jgi:hypothetical protein
LRAKRKATPVRAALVLVRLAYDRQFIITVLFFLVLYVFLFIRISGRHHDSKSRPDRMVGSFLVDA